jgi:GT2 family glycosyltransferase
VGGRIDHETLNDAKTRAWRGKGGHPGLPVLLDFLPYALGANMGVWAEVLAEVGGWNEDFGTGGDDVELCWRAHLRGYPLGFAADAVVSYRHRPDLRGLARQMYRYGLAEPHIYRLYLAAGVPRQTFREGVSRWVHLGLGVTDLLRAEPRRGLWVRQAAFRLGRLQGSVRHRVWCV